MGLIHFFISASCTEFVQRYRYSFVGKLSLKTALAMLSCCLRFILLFFVRVFFWVLTFGKSHHDNSKVHNVRLLKVSKTLQIGVTNTKPVEKG